MIIRPTLPETPNYTTPRGTIGLVDLLSNKGTYQRSLCPP